MTQNAQHTPWILSTNTNDTHEKPLLEACVEDGNGEIIGFFTDIPKARLIAASPELLHALKLALEAMEEEAGIRGANDENYEVPMRRYIHAAKAAIAKATGQAA